MKRGSGFFGFTAAPLAALITCAALHLANPLTAPAAEADATAISRMEDIHHDMSDVVLKMANSIDGFFGTERYETFEQNESYIRLRLNLDWMETSGADLSPNVKIQLILPGTMDRIKVVANEDDDEGAEAGGRDAENESDIALRFVGFESDRTGLSFDVGARIRDWVFAGFGRVNLQFTYPLGGEWIGRSTNRLYWYTDTGFRNDFRQYFERKITDNFFFRSRTRLQYFEEEDANPFPEQKFTLFQRVGDRLGLAYEAIGEKIPADDTPFDEEDILEIDDAYTQFTLRIRSRFKTRWPWLYFEVWPAVVFPEELDYDATLAARFRIEVTFGHIRDAAVTVEE
jgi:hypothetical protein